MLVLLHLDGAADRPRPAIPVLAGGRVVGRLGTVVEHVDLGPIALALLKRGLPADTPLRPAGSTRSRRDRPGLAAAGRGHAGAGRDGGGPVAGPASDVCPSPRRAWQHSADRAR